jgi:hypothetical protein
MLTHQLMFVLHHSSAVLQHKSVAHHALEIFKVLGLQIIVLSIIQSIYEAIMLLLINVNFMGSIAKQLSELGDILVHIHGSLLQILKLLL